MLGYVFHQLEIGSLRVSQSRHVAHFRNQEDILRLLYVRVGFSELAHTDKHWLIEISNGNAVSLLIVLSKRNLLIRFTPQERRSRILGLIDSVNLIGLIVIVQGDNGLANDLSKTIRSDWSNEFESILLAKDSTRIIDH